MMELSTPEMETQKSICISSRTENISDVEKMIDVVCDEYAVNRDFYGNILIAITEAVNNAIIHGNKENPEKMIHVKCESEKDALKFIVEDEGDGFDFDSLPDPTDPENIEKPNGRGVFLMKNLADDVKFHERGRVVELNFIISAN